MPRPCCDFLQYQLREGTCFEVATEQPLFATQMALVFGFGRRVQQLNDALASRTVIGEAIGIRVVEGPRGLMAAQVTSWDRGTEQGASSLADENLGDQVQDIKDFMAHVAE